jgi:hypothetical protein
MLGILRKDSGIFALASLVVFPIILLIESATVTELRPALVMTNIILAWLVVFVPLNITEMEEEHSNGYVLLGSLPVRAREIVAGKFLLYLAAIAACTAVQLALLEVVHVAPALLVLAHTAVLLTSSASLLFGGIAYATIFCFGFARLMQALPLVIVASGVAAPILFAKPAARELVREAAGVLLRLSGLEIVLGGLALYVLLFLVSVALFRFEPKRRYRPPD